MKNHWANTINIIKKALLQKKRYAFILLNQKNKQLVKNLYNIGVINSFFIFENKIRVLLVYQKQANCFFQLKYIKKKIFSIKIIKNMSKKHTVFFLISTPRKILPLFQCENKKVGGRVICELFC